ncbi:MAG: VWA domain-containing protein, partial [Acidobacteriota bacterium]
FRQPPYPAVPPPPPPPGRWPPSEEGRIYLPRPPVDFNTEGYENIVDNPFLEVTQNPLSTFSIDVDTASYANVRRFLDQGGLPPRDAVRIEELVNYFDYDYKGPGREGPFAAHFEMTDAPWNTEHRLLRIGLKAKEIKGGERPETNLIFLIDVSGSMAAPNKHLLVQDAMHMLIDRLTENDHVAIVTYAGSTRVALPSTRGNRKWSIHRAVDSLRSGGSTAGASGIQLAYETAQRNFIKGGVNRVILATDGDFNVGITNHGDLARLIEEKASSGVFLSALGFGMGNYKDDTLELLANKGRGNYAYIDTIEEARKVLVEQINATLVGVAKDVKIQVEFNPARVGAYRLIGYEDRIMAKEDFNDDTKKAGVIGAGHAVTALYEIVPAGKPIPSSGVDPLKYQKPVETTRAASSDEAGTVKIRYKEPEGEKSSLMEFAVRDSGREFEKASGDFKFAASVAAFGMVLRDSPYKGSATLEHALDWAKEGKGDDPHGYRTEYIRLLHRAMSIKK